MSNKKSFGHRRKVAQLAAGPGYHGQKDRWAACAVGSSLNRMLSVRCAGRASFHALGGGLAARQDRGQVLGRERPHARGAGGPVGGCACGRARSCGCSCLSKALLTKLIEEAASPEAKALVGIVEAA
ncbi:MAG: hypothetical protein M0Q13_07185 [Methanothrix sp.]|jgi:hypothetical protein|nr:hypothetical protein [Methanothrix sp.]